MEKRTSANAKYFETIKNALREVKLSGEPPLERPGSWLTKWFDPVESAEMFNRWHFYYLTGLLSRAPLEQAIVYVDALAEDLRNMATEEAAKRFVDKLYPRVLSNSALSDLEDPS